MAKRVTTTDWEVIIKDETGAMIDLGYTCPYCQLENGGIISVSPGPDFDYDSGFETDQVCEFCGKDVIVVCI